MDLDLKTICVVDDDPAVAKTITCSFCEEVLKTPRILQCMHTFCAGCLELKMITEDGVIVCTLCQHETRVSKDTEILKHQ